MCQCITVVVDIFFDDIACGIVAEGISWSPFSITVVWVPACTVRRSSPRSSVVCRAGRGGAPMMVVVSTPVMMRVSLASNYHL